MKRDEIIKRLSEIDFERIEEGNLDDLRYLKQDAKLALTETEEEQFNKGYEQGLEHCRLLQQRPSEEEAKDEIEELWEKYSELQRISLDDIIGFQCMDKFQFKAASKAIIKLLS